MSSSHDLPYPIPGPAGTLPQSRPTPSQSLPTSSSSFLLTPPWLCALSHLSSPPYGTLPLSSSIALLRAHALSETPHRLSRLPVRIESLSWVGRDASVVLADPTARIQATLHAGVFDQWKKGVEVGGVLVLNSVAAVWYGGGMWRKEGEDAGLHVSVGVSSVKIVFGACSVAALEEPWEGHKSYTQDSRRPRVVRKERRERMGRIPMIPTTDLQSGVRRPGYQSISPSRGGYENRRQLRRPLSAGRGGYSTPMKRSYAAEATSNAEPYNRGRYQSRARARYGEGVTMPYRGRGGVPYPHRTHEEYTQGSRNDNYVNTHSGYANQNRGGHMNRGRGGYAIRARGMHAVRRPGMHPVRRSGMQPFRTPSNVHKRNTQVEPLSNSSVQPTPNIRADVQNSTNGEGMTDEQLDSLLGGVDIDAMIAASGKNPAQIVNNIAVLPKDNRNDAQISEKANKGLNGMLSEAHTPRSSAPERGRTGDIEIVEERIIQGSATGTPVTPAAKHNQNSDEGNPKSLPKIRPVQVPQKELSKADAAIIDNLLEGLDDTCFD